MFHRIARLVILWGVLALMAGCGPRQNKLTMADNGTNRDIGVGGQIIVELNGNPSTGYTWEAKDLDVGILQQVGTGFKSSNPGMVGAGGTLTLTFKALKAGVTTLTLVYHRPWEKDVKPLSTFVVTITIK